MVIDPVKLYSFDAEKKLRERRIINDLSFRRTALTDKENELIAQEYQPNQILPVNENFQAYVEKTARLPRDLRPSLKEELNGSFSLSTCNQGDETHKSMIVFELKNQNQPQNEGGILHPDEIEWLSKSLAIIPFVDLFQREIVHEAQRAEKLIKAASVSSLSQRKQKAEAETVETILHAFHWALGQSNDQQTEQRIVSLENIKEEMSNKKPEEKEPFKYGQEAMADNLATALKADIRFYNEMWDQINRFFAPSIRHVGEQYALGNISLYDNRPEIV